MPKLERDADNSVMYASEYYSVCRFGQNATLRAFETTRFSLWISFGITIAFSSAICATYRRGFSYNEATFIQKWINFRTSLPSSSPPDPTPAARPPCCAQNPQRGAKRNLNPNVNSSIFAAGDTTNSEYLRCKYDREIMRPQFPSTKHRSQFSAVPYLELLIHYVLDGEVASAPAAQNKENCPDQQYGWEECESL